MTPIDHESAGDQLVPYVRGELHADTVREIEEHLDSCADCRLELAAVRALLAGDVPPMSDIERANLRRGIRQSVDVSAPATSGMAWLAPALGVAAMLLVVVLGMQFLGGMGGSDDSGANGGAGGADERALDADDVDGPKPVTVRFAGTGFTRATGALSSESGDVEAAMPPDEEPVQAGDAPSAASNGQASSPKSQSKERRLEYDADLIQKRLSRYASTGEVFVSFARAYTAEDAEPLRDAFTAALLDDAPPGTGDQLVDCADFIARARPSSLPAVAGHGRFAGKPALMLGFVWSEEAEGPLSEYMIFVWARGSCETILHSQFGQIRT